MTMAVDVHDEYRFDDRSVLLRWLRGPVLMPIVRALPRRLTPNQITVFGHICFWTGAVVALTMLKARTFALLALAFGYTAYNVADTIDGMYARHSGKTSRLGELLDHGLDPYDAALIPLTYGVALREPGWLIVASTATVAYMQFLTFLHGYRVGYVILGEIGVIEGLALAAGVCLAAALGALAALSQPVFRDVSWAGLLAIGLIVGALPALVSMRGLRRHPGDLVPPALVIAAVVVWYAFGALDVRAAGVLILFSGAYEMMLVTSARLQKLTLALWDVPFTLTLLGIVAASIAFDVDPGIQLSLAAALILYALLRSALHFVRTASAIGA